MKFTEEQYQKIVDAWDSHIMYTSKTRSVIEELKAGYLGMVDKALALANPLTREWAHDQFVEKEKKYVWRLKSDNDLVISKWTRGWFANNMPTSNKYFSETEIKNSPFEPKWFEKEEVK